MSTHSDVTSFAGSLGDGRSAEAKPVEASFADTGLELRTPEGSAIALWPYALLRSAVPLHAKAADVLLSLEPEGSQTLFVADPAFAGQLLARAPALSALRHRWRGLRPGLAVTAAVLALVLGIRFLEVDPAQAVARNLPQKSREALGRNVVTALAKDHKACETPASRAALDRLTQRLTATSPNPMQVRVALLDWRLVNALAVPGGQIVLTRGLVQAAGSPDEVAAVLAHELGHALELHPETGIVRAMGLSAAAQLMFAGSAGSVSNVGLVLTQLRYSRIAEREADAHALRMLKAAGISSKGFGDFFERLEGKRPASDTGKSIPGLDLISTHPATAERIAMVRAQAAYPATPALSAEDWKALREACGPVPAPRPADADAAADREIAEATKALEKNSSDAAALQRRARAYAKKRQHDQAVADFSKAIQLKPNDATLRFLRGQAHHNLRRHEDALRDYDEALKLEPAHLGARNGRANTNRAMKRYEAALTDYDELIRYNPKFVAGYFNRALVQIDLNKPDDAMRDLNEAIALDKEYAGAYAQRGLLHEKLGARELAIADFRAALAAPSKFDSTTWAHNTARTRLAALGVEAR
jgi:predicted Zn-dependent protease